MRTIEKTVSQMEHMKCGVCGNHYREIWYDVHLDRHGEMIRKVETDDYCGECETDDWEE
jgi:hypothetical protein